MNKNLEAAAKVTGNILGGAVLITLSVLGMAYEAEAKKGEAETLAEASKIRAGKIFASDPKAVFAHINGMTMSTRYRAAEMLEASGFVNNGYSTWLEKRTGAIGTIRTNDEGNYVIDIR